MKVRVRVKTFEEIKECGHLDKDGDYQFCESDGGYVYFFPSMVQYCGKIIELEDWNGNIGLFADEDWYKEMLSEIDVIEHNRNGANS